MPCPTTTSRPPTGRAADPQHGQLAGRASAHVGVRAIQDLIPCALATNLWMLRVASIAREARRRRARPAKARPSPSPSFSSCPASTRAATRWPSRPTRRSPRGERLRLPPRHQVHHDAVLRVGGDEMAIIDEEQAPATQRRLPGAVTMCPRAEAAAAAPAARASASCSSRAWTARTPASGPASASCSSRAPAGRASAPGAQVSASRSSPGPAPARPALARSVRAEATSCPSVASAPRWADSGAAVLGSEAAPRVLRVPAALRPPAAR